MSVSQESINRAAMSAGLWFAVAYGLGLVSGVELSMFDTAVDAAIMGGSALSSDLIHSYINMIPTVYSSAAVTGGLYAAAQRAYRGDTNYLVNAAVAGGNDVLVEWWATRMGTYSPNPATAAAMAASSSPVAPATGIGN